MHLVGHRKDDVVERRGTIRRDIAGQRHYLVLRAVNGGQKFYGRLESAARPHRDNYRLQPAQPFLQFRSSRQRYPKRRGFG
mgnify:CR=1 FL=1